MRLDIITAYHHIEQSMLRACSIKTKLLRLRTRDKHAKFLRHLADEVNFVWNYCNELQLTMWGLEDLVATSDAEKVIAPQFYRGLEPKLAVAQRAGKKDRARAIHAKIANRRKDSLHQFSARLVRAYDTIFVGNVNASALAKTPRAKSVLDAGWSAFRTMLRYKCDFAGATFAEVNEAFSTQTCSVCDSRSGSKGIAGLGIRVWTCSECGTFHDRNVNAAKNILAAGRRRLAEGIPALQGVGGRQIQYPCSIEQQ